MTSAKDLTHNVSYDIHLRYIVKLKRESHAIDITILLLLTKAAVIAVTSGAGEDATVTFAAGFLEWDRG